MPRIDFRARSTFTAAPFVALVESGGALSNSTIYPAGAVSDFRVGNVLSRAWTVFTNNFIIFFVITLIVSLPNLLAASSGATDPSANPSAFLWRIGVGALLVIILNTIGEAVIVYGAFQNLRGQPVRLGEALQKGLARFFPILGLAIVSGIAIMFGVMLLIIPGLILLVMWSVALPVCVLEGLGPLSSLGRSSALTKGHRWKILGIVLLLFVANGLVGYVLERVLGPMGVMTAAVASLIWTALWGAYYNSALVMIYHDLRVSKEGVDVGQIAAVFD
jgi:hypothetical protein